MAMKRRRKRRNNRGYALVSILVIGSFAVMFMLGLATMLLSIAQSEMVEKAKSGLLNAAEIGMDYALKDMNSSIEAGTPSLFEVSDASPSATVTVPSSYVPYADTTVKVRVSKLTDTERLEHRTFGVLYAPQLEPLEGSTADYSNPVGSVIGSDHTRVLEVTAQRGAFFKSIRAVLQPRMAPPETGMAYPNVNDQSPLFSNSGIFSVSTLNINPSDSLTINGSTPSPVFDNGSENEFHLKLQTNKDASIQGNTTLNGDLLVSNNPGSAPNDIVNLSSSTDVNGRLQTNNNSNASVTPNTSPTFPVDPGANVNASADAFASSPPPGPQGANLTPNLNNANVSPVEPSPVPSVPTQAVETPSSAITTNDFTSFMNSVSGGNYSGSPSSTVTLSQHGTVPGTADVVSSYTTTALNTSNVASVNVTAAQPTQVFVNGTGSDPVNINASDFVNSTGNPANLQIMYDGTGNVNINLDSNGSTFSALVYAPNATINVSSRPDVYTPGPSVNTNTTFNGALSGKSVNVTMNGTMNLLTDLGTPGGGGGGGVAPTIGITNPGDSSSIAAYGYSSKTFQEVPVKLVP